MNIDEAKLIEHWHTLDIKDKAALQAARAECHHAVQLVGIAGRGMLPEDPGDESANLEWLPHKKWLAGRFFGRDDVQYRAAISLSALTIYLADSNNEAVYELALNGQTFNQAFEWLKTHLSQLNLDVSRLSTALPYKMPETSRDGTTPFALQASEVMQEFDDAFYNAAGLMQVVTAAIASASPPRCWPHHFDLATLITLKPHEEPEKATTIGFGMSPGDERYPEPYFYVTPWPYPDAAEVTKHTLEGGGQWHTEGWVGALLTADVLLQATDNEQQARQTIAFGRSALNILVNLLQ